MDTLQEKQLIFLVEDNPIFAEVVKTGIENELDLTVLHFSTGEEMLDYLIKNPLVRPEIFILDFELNSKVESAKNGKQILQELVQRYKQKKIIEELKVIMLTGSGEIELAIDLLKLGATDYISKFKENDNNYEFFEKLKKTIRNILNMKALKAEKMHYQQKSETYRKRLIYISIALTLVIITLGLVYFNSK